MEAVRQYNVHEAKTHFSRVLEQVAADEEVVISKAGEPVAKLVPLAPQGETDRPRLAARVLPYPG
ncbi:prevent-host-death family protein [Streptomyces sp. MP131-18]|nr:type II toxin-antitoxin system prevent-host-death family antitoxin [Streptomyces sp. MP131-18]ONK15209.1 prevent-host-death family protein [Streptomyces sp. MP131-18]